MLCTFYINLSYCFMSSYLWHRDSTVKDQRAHAESAHAETAHAAGLGVVPAVDCSVYTLIRLVRHTGLDLVPVWSTGLSVSWVRSIKIGALLSESPSVLLLLRELAPWLTQWSSILLLFHLPIHFSETQEQIRTVLQIRGSISGWPNQITWPLCTRLEDGQST